MFPILIVYSYVVSYPFEPEATNVGPDVIVFVTWVDSVPFTSTAISLVVSCSAVFAVPVFNKYLSFTLIFTIPVFTSALATDHTGDTTSTTCWLPVPGSFTPIVIVLASFAFPEVSFTIFAGNVMLIGPL